MNSYLTCEHFYPHPDHECIDTFIPNQFGQDYSLLDRLSGNPQLIMIIIVYI